MHTFSQKKTNFGATSASQCSRLPGTENVENTTGQKSSHEYTHTPHENLRAVLGLSARQEQDDDKDVVKRQFSNGCDKSFKQVPIDEILCSRLEEIHMDSATETIGASVAIDFVASHSTVISNAAQCTTTSNKSQDFIAESGAPCATAATIGNDDITNTEVENSHATYEASPTDPNAFNLACQAQTLPVPLHACDTSIIHPHCNSANHIEYHNFTSELTNALSSQLLVKLTESSYCNNFASLSQSQRQSSFLKSQSLDIVQDPPSITYIENDELVFIQLPEINEVEQHQRTQYMKQDDVAGDQVSLQNGSNYQASWAPASTTTSSAQKTGLALKTQSLDSRPIYPNVPYSPYASPYSSPRSNRRRPPLRESRRISIEQSGSFLQLNQYKLMDQIGQGSYGLVKLAYSEEDSTHYAMKILSKRRLLRQAGLMKRGPKKGTSPLDRVYREIAVLKKLDHPNVVKLIEVLDDPIEDSLYMVFELVKQGEVLSIPTQSPLSEERAWSVFRDTLLGLEYYAPVAELLEMFLYELRTNILTIINGIAHTQISFLASTNAQTNKGHVTVVASHNSNVIPINIRRIIHADIKPGNLLLTECGRVKIADLGVCNEFIGEDSTMTNGSTAGTPAFRAPETLNVGQNIYCGKAADIWALGATLYALIYGNVPFAATSVPVLYETIKNSTLRFADNIKVCPELMDCIQHMLVKDPASRITLPELKVHPWVTASGLHPLPSEEENCRLVQVNDDDISSVVRSIPKLDTLILIKTMLKKHSFGNPFSRGVSGRAPQRGGSRLERFIRAGRSNSAPGAYPIADRQLSGDSILPALSEHTPSNCTNEECQ